MEFISTPRAPAAIGPYSQAVKWGNLLMTSGQIPLDPEGNLVAGGIEEQTHRVFQNLKAVLEAGRSHLSERCQGDGVFEKYGPFCHGQRHLRGVLRRPQTGALRRGSVPFAERCPDRNRNDGLHRKLNQKKSKNFKKKEGFFTHMWKYKPSLFYTKKRKKSGNLQR